MKRRKAWKGSSIAVAALLAMLWAGDALAAQKFLAPLLDKGDGSIECTNCCTGSSLTSGSVLVGGGSSAVSALANNGTATVMYLTSSTGTNPPAWRAPLLNDAAADSITSAQLYAKITDETGSGTGTPKAVFSENPSIVGVTGTGTWNLSGITAPLSLPNDALDDIADFKSTIKTGTGATKLATTAGGSTTTGKQVQFDANGNLEATATDIGGGSAVYSYSDVSPLTQVIASTTPLYCGLDGSCSTTEADVQTSYLNSGSLTSLECRATAGTTQAITAVIGVGTCGSALTYTGGKATSAMSATAWAAGSPTGTTSWTTGQCLAMQFTTSSGTSAKVAIRCSVKQSAGT